MASMRGIAVFIFGLFISPAALADCEAQSDRVEETRDALRVCQRQQGDCSLQRRRLEDARMAARECRRQARAERRQERAPAQLRAPSLPPPTRSGSSTQGAPMSRPRQ